VRAPLAVTGARITRLDEAPLLSVALDSAAMTKVEAAGIEPASRSHPGLSIYARVPRFGSRSAGAHGRATV